MRVEYQLTNPKPGVVHLQAMDFSDFRPVSGVLYPFNVVMHRDDQQDQVISIQTVTPTLTATVTAGAAVATSK